MAKIHINRKELVKLIMEENQNIQGGNQQQVVTPTTEPQVVEEQKPQERTYTKAEVQDLMRKRVERSHKAFFTRYGVNDLGSLDELMSKSKTFGDDFLSMQNKNNELTRENAFLRNNINPAKYDDIITHFKGMGIDFSEEQLLEALKTHPEWLKEQAQVTTIQKMGSEFHTNDTPNEKELASKLLGVRI